MFTPNNASSVKWDKRVASETVHAVVGRVARYAVLRRRSSTAAVDLLLEAVWSGKTTDDHHA